MAFISAAMNVRPLCRKELELADLLSPELCWSVIGWQVFRTGGGVWPANYKKLDKAYSPHTRAHLRLVPSPIHTHRCVVTG